ncbi:MAG: TolC family protein [Gemmatimonadota bacterium]|nr:TolC family protein [Gemmatimonadota bacterium]
MRPTLAALTALCGLCLYLPTHLPAQAVELGPTRRVTLTQALDLIETGNLDLQLARAEVEAARARTVAAGVRPNPVLAAEHQQLSGYYETTVQGSQALVPGGQRRLRLEASERGVSAAEARLDAERLRLGFEVRRVYVRALAAEARLAVLAEAAELFRQGARAGQARFREGDISDFALQRLRLERARYDGLLARTRLDLRQAGRELTVLVAADSLGAGFLLLPAERLDAGAAGAVVSLEAVLARAAERPNLRAATAEIEAARAELALQQALRRPPLTVSGGLRNQSDGARGVVVGASMPLGLRDRNQGGIAIAEAALRNAEARRAILFRRGQAEVRRAWETRTLLSERLAGLERELLVPSARLLRTARVAYAEGEMTLVELLDAADAYRSAREAVADLQAEYLVAAYDLERATGAPLSPTTAQP